MAAARQAGAEATPWAADFLVEQRKAWVDKGGEVIALPAADKAEMMARLATVGDDIVKAGPQAAVGTRWSRPRSVAIDADPADVRHTRRLRAFAV